MTVGSAFEALAYLLLAAALGAMIGFERRWQGHVAGPHTSALVAVGSAMYVVVAADLAGPADVIRAVGQVAVGIGFLCSGVIVRNGLDVRGLNTAATLWCIGAIGSLIGARFAVIGTVAAFAVVGLNVALHMVEHRITRLRQDEDEPPDQSSIGPDQPGR